MLKNHIDIILFSIFLATNLILGLIAGRRVRTLRDYSIGNKDFSTGTLTATIVATGIGGGSMIYGLANVYSSGLRFIIPLLGMALGLFLTGIVTERMGEFLNNLSIAEAMGSLYGKAARMVTAFSGVLWGIGVVAIQFKVVSKILTLILGIEGPGVTIAAALIIIIYSAFGGIRAVTITDIFQFFAFGIFIPILALVIWNSIKEPHKTLYVLTTNPIFSFKGLISWDTKFANFLTLLIYGVTPTMVPEVFQRIVMAKDPIQAKKAHIYAAGIFALMCLFIIWIGILLLANNPNLVPSNLVNFIIDNHSYPFLKSLIGVGIVSMAMSTADSSLNASVVLFVNDIIKPLEIGDKKLLLITRLLAFVLGVLALLLALSMQDLFSILLLSGSFYMPIVSVPLLLAIFGFRSTTRTVLIGMLAGFSTVLFWELFFSKSGFDILGVGMAANLVFLIGSHYILKEKGGWVGIKVPGPLIAARQRRKDAWIRFINSIKETRIYDYLERNLPEREIVYSGFAIYVMGATYSSFYTIPEQVLEKYAILYKIIYHSVLVLTAAFLTFPAWPPTFKSKRFITFAWPAGIFYILFVVGSMLVIMSGFHEVQVMIFMVNLLIAAFSLSFPLMSLLSGLGTLIGYIVFKLAYGTIYYVGAADCTQFKAIYMVLLFGSLLVALFRFKKSKQFLEAKATYLEKDEAEQNDELADMVAYRDVLLKELNQDELSLFDHTTAAYLNQIIYRMTEYIRLEVTSINLDKLMLEIKDLIKMKYFDNLDNAPQIIVKKHIQEGSINADYKKLKRLLVNGITYVHQHNPSNEPVTIILEDAKLGHSIGYMKDYTRQIAALKISIVLDHHIPPKKISICLTSLCQLANPIYKQKKGNS